MLMNAEESVEAIGPCTQDVRDCEIMRTAFVLQDVALEDENSQAIRFELAKVACADCRNFFLKDVVVN